jgi:hypothetical protein
MASQKIAAEVDVLAAVKLSYAAIAEVPVFFKSWEACLEAVRQCACICA